MVFNPLKSGDFLGVVASSSPAQKERFEAAASYVSTLGIKLKVMGTPWAEYGTDRFLFASASAEERARFLHELFMDSTVGAIIAARGAGGVLDVLPLLDRDLIARHRKPVVGFSDTTALLLALQKYDVPVIHGPHIESFTKAATDEAAAMSARQLFDLLQHRRSPLMSLPLTPLVNAADVVGDGVAFTGGNLTSVASVCGTPWQADAAGKIVFLEESSEKPHRVHRMIGQLIYSGVLSKARAVVLGAFTNCVAPHGPDVTRVLRESLQQLKIPVFAGLSAGHIPANTPIPFFGRAEIKQNALTVTLE